MVINLSDVLSEQHKPIDVTVSFELEEIRMKSGVFPIVEKDPVHVGVSHRKNKELEIQAETRVSALIPCDRCLSEVKEEISLCFTKQVDLGTSDAELPEGFDESNFIDGYYLDVTKCSITRYWWDGRQTFFAVKTVRAFAAFVVRI